jgi:hypothetical protein
MQSKYKILTSDLWIGQPIKRAGKISIADVRIVLYLNLHARVYNTRSRYFEYLGMQPVQRLVLAIPPEGPSTAIPNLYLRTFWEKEAEPELCVPGAFDRAPVAMGDVFCFCNGSHNMLFVENQICIVFSGEEIKVNVFSSRASGKDRGSPNRFQYYFNGIRYLSCLLLWPI